jgi:hypothetical protein
MPLTINTIEMPREQARVMRDEYLASIQDRRVSEDASVRARLEREDAEVLDMLKELSKGLPVLNLFETMKGAGVDSKGRPLLAIARADLERVRFERRWHNDYCFGDFDNWFRRARQNNSSRLFIKIPAEFLPGVTLPQGQGLKAIVPTIPPRFRPTRPLKEFHILWEADWQAVPVDPILLRRITRTQYAVLAQWDLTEVERAVLAGRLIG